MPTQSSHVDLTVMRMSHAAFRRDWNRLTDALDKKSLEDPLQRRRVISGWEIFKHQLHIHHEGEDAELWPRMTNGLTGRAEVVRTLVELEAEHARIDPMLLAVEQAMADPRSRARELGESVETLRVELQDHLSHEEKDGLPYIGEALGEREWKAFLRSQQRGLGLSGAAELFPWMLDEASPEDAARLSGIMPPPLKLVLRFVWQPRYRAREPWPR